METSIISSRQEFTKKKGKLNRTMSKVVPTFEQSHSEPTEHMDITKTDASIHQMCEDSHLANESFTSSSTKVHEPDTSESEAAIKA